LRRGSIRWRSGGALLGAALAAVALGVPGPAGARGVHVFAFQPKLDLAWMESRQTFHDKLLALADRRLRGAGRPLIQTGADDLASHLRGPSDRARPVATARDLAVLPEDTGLFAALTGQRGAAARSSGTLEGTIVALIGAYGPQNSYYSGKYPDLAPRAPQTRLLAVALTDTFGRVAVETFAELARRYHVWLEAGIDMAQDWKVVCNDRGAFNSARPPRLPTGERCAEQNPQRVKQLGDPFEPARDYAYEAVSPLASNIALVFDPTGRLVSRQVKEYLTPIELPGQLDLVPGTVDRGLSALRTPVGTLGFVTSKDAWMPDVQSRLDEAHVDVLVQPEFFVGDTASDDTHMWAPDTMLASGYSDVLRLPSVETLVEPDLVGNVDNFTADAQSHIALKPHGRRRPKTGPAGHLVGQPNRPGLASVMPWVVPDPFRPSEPIAVRRHRVAAAGRALLPGSGVDCPDPARPGPCENGHVEGVLWRNVTVNPKRAFHLYRGGLAKTDPFGPSRPVHRSGNAQRNAAIAMRGEVGVVAFEERRKGRDQVLLARTADGGLTWSASARPTGRPPGRANEQWPAAAIGANGRVTVAWNDDSTGVPRSYVARSTDGGRTFGPPRPIDPSAPPAAAQWRPALAQGRGEVVHAVFVDARARSADDDLPQAHVYYARVTGGTVEPARRLDTGEPAPLAAKLDNSWVPRVTARGARVLVAWTDFLNYDWGVFSRASTNFGATFGQQVRVTDNREGESQQEELADSPDPLLMPRGSLVVWTDWRKRHSTGPRPHPQYDVFAAPPGRPNVQVDPHGARPVSAFAPSGCAAGDQALVAFQDESRAQSKIRLVRVVGGVRRGPALRVDDGGSRAGDAWRPRLACSGGRAVAAFESERDGPGQIYLAAASLASLRRSSP
jgi:hypothetical protein